MSEKKDILTDLFRDRLSDYQQPVDDGVWAKIEQDLSKEKKAVPFFFHWKALSIGIAATLALVFGFDFLTNLDKTISQQPIAFNKSSQIKKTNTLPTLEQQTASTSNTNKQHVIAGNTHQISNQFIELKKVVEKGKTTCVTPDDTIHEETNIGRITLTENTDNKSQNILNGQTEKSLYNNQYAENKVKPAENQKKLNFPSKPKETVYQPKKKKDRGVAFALLAANTNSSSSFSENTTNHTGTFSETHTETHTETIRIPTTGSTTSDPNNPGYITKVITTTREVTSYYDLITKNYTSTDVEYNMPISIGFSVRKHLTDAWAIESGLSYTYLSSTETYQLTTQQDKVAGNNTQILISENSTIRLKNELNYIGIPLKLIYSFLNKENLSLYAGAGAMGEMCVYANSTDLDSKSSEELDINPIQWSMLGNIGINYRIFNHWGIFVEPGVAYYFDDGSPIKTIRKDKPFNFNFQAGIRLSY